LTNRDLYTLALGVNSLSMYMPGVPDTILYFVAQRAFVRGIVLTGLKG